MCNKRINSLGLRNRRRDCRKHSYTFSDAAMRRDIYALRQKYNVFCIYIRKRSYIQVLHGCRQTVLWNVRQCQATVATPTSSWESTLEEQRTFNLKGGRGWRQIIMAFMGWAIHVLQWRLQRVATAWARANPGKAVGVRNVRCNSRTWSRNR